MTASIFFREIKNSGKCEISFGRHEKITFPCKEIRSILGFEGVPDGNGIHIDCKVNATADKLMKTDDT